jgi:hypothetical protein
VSEGGEGLSAGCGPIPEVAPLVEDPNYLCGHAREGREFALADRATGEVLPVETEQAARELAERRYPGAKFLLTRASSSVLGQHLGDFVVMMVFQRRPPADAVVSGPAPEVQWQAVACVSGAVHGPRCIPFSIDAWPEDTVVASSVVLPGQSSTE